MQNLHGLKIQGVIDLLLKTQKDIEFNQISTFLCRRLMHRKRLYYDPFPNGEYNAYLYIEGYTFGVFVYKNSFDEGIYTANSKFKPVGIIRIKITGNDFEIQSVIDKKKHSLYFIREFACLVLQIIGLYQLPKIKKRKK